MMKRNNRFELWVNKGEYIRIDNCMTDMNLKESIDEIAYTMKVELAATKNILLLNLTKGTPIELWGYHYYTGAYWLIFRGVIWEKSFDRGELKINLTCKERTIYLAESEEEWVWNEGETATYRLKKIAEYMEIPISVLPDTEIGLKKDRRSENQYSSIRKDLCETAQKGGKLYRARMDEKLDLMELGTNIYVEEISNICEKIIETESFNGLVTKVKVLGKNEGDEDNLVYSPVIGEYWKDTEKYGWIQKIVQDSKIEDWQQGKDKADLLFNPGEDSIQVSCTEDINILRAGNKVKYYGNEYIITDMEHIPGGRGKMNLTLMTYDQVKTKFYNKD